jgi:hypothetical protein
MGYLTLARTPPNKVAEVCAQLMTMQNTTQPPQENGLPAPHKWLFHLFNLRFVLLNDIQGKEPAADSAANGTAGAAANETAAGNTADIAVAAGETDLSIAPPVGMPADVRMQMQSEPEQYQHFKPTANMLELEKQLRAAARLLAVLQSHRTASRTYICRLLQLLLRCQV